MLKGDTVRSLLYDDDLPGVVSTWAKFLVCVDGFGPCLA